MCAYVGGDSILVNTKPGKYHLHDVHSFRQRLHDLLLLQTDDSTLFEHQSLPVSPYPASVNTTVAAHFVTETKPNEDGWTPCFNGTLFRKWVTGTVIGYKDFAGNEAKPGTYDSLPHMFFTQVPTPGSSGGPVIDLDTGAVIGLIRGSQLDNRLSGLRGWGTSAESIYEMFTLPGIHRS
ncbi:hypothetical protein FRC19_002610 [Serendipita sp. 401]|nr:hypothetical protein FRC19_002610 [Serendipita sp. 401]